jgi:hypothetical protein
MPETQTFTFETNPFTFETSLADEVVLTFKNPAQLNQMWGSIASQVGQSGIMGEHSSAHGRFTPDPFPDPHTSEPARDGVGNASKTNTNFQNPDLTLVDNPLSEGAQGLHGLFQGVRLGDADLGAIPEAEVGPFLPEPHGNVTVDVVIDVIDPLAI